jgi:pimeloyl-ACP methyl ester carboxylesterase
VSGVAATVETAAGPVEVVRAGEGPPVLFVHGTPGGWDSSLAMGRFLLDAGFELIAPARPGYQGTPLQRRSIDEQADLLAAVLEATGCERAGVVSWSGGGPSAYRLAVRHSERVAALVAFAAVSKAYPRPKAGLDERLVMDTRAGNWLMRMMTAHFPKTMVSSTLKAEGNLDHRELEELVSRTMEDERALDVVLAMDAVIGDGSNRRAGVENDWEQFARISSLGLDRIQAPALVIHGSADTDVPPEHGEFAAEVIPGAEHLVMGRGTHLCLFAHPEAGTAQERVVSKLRDGVDERT